jgi:hypothetical protein
MGCYCTKYAIHTYQSETCCKNCRVAPWNKPLREFDY